MPFFPVRSRNVTVLSVGASTTRHSSAFPPSVERTSAATRRGSFSTRYDSSSGMIGTLLRAAALSLAFLPLGCSSDNGGQTEEGGATLSVCPESDPPSYESFGRSFMASYCTRCHSSAVSGAARFGAPDDHNFDSLEGVLDATEHIDELAAAGPAGINESMPESGPSPSEAERRRLGEWLACETAKAESP